VLYGDLDDFKGTNDAHGHHAGDQLLRALAERLEGVLPPGATLARLGGDEFVVLLDGVGDAADALGVAATLQAALAAPFIVTGHALQVSLSFGVALAGPGETSAEGLLQAADVALYQAKRRGKAQAVLAGAAG
jgi:diguanylate cyclase (GGDEF)-like protein